MSWTRRTGWALALLGAALLALWGGRVLLAAGSLLEHVRQLQALADEPESLNPQAACSLVYDLRQDVVGLDADAGGLIRLAPVLGWLPAVGGELRAAPHLLDVGDGLTEAGVLACDALQPALAAFTETDGASGEFSPEQMVRLLAQERSTMQQALSAVERAQAAWAHVDVDSLSPSVAEKASLLDRGLPVLRSGLEAMAVAPELLGLDGSRTYLVLALNEDEPRPGGGFITGVGEVRVEAGQLITMTFRDSYAADDFRQPYPDPPEPLRRYMGIDLWVFRDSNWSPDFPTAARQALALYRPGYPVSVDGVIALDQQAVARLVGVLGPLQLRDAEEMVTGETVIGYMRRARAPEEGMSPREWRHHRKSFIAELAQVSWDRLQSGAVDWVALARALVGLLEEKHLLIYLEQTDAALVLANQGWDGALRIGAGDFLMAVDASVGYNKAGARVHEALTYQVDLRPSPPQAVLTLVYTHTSTADTSCVFDFNYGPMPYEQMMDQCYWDYLRIYVPQGSRLVDASRLPVPGDALLSGEAESGDVTVRQAEEGPWMTFGVLGLVPPSSIQTRSLTWTLPADVVQLGDGIGEYVLWAQKQPGTRGHALTVRVRLPEANALMDATPKPSEIDDGWVIYRTTLRTDREFTIRFEGKP